MAAQEQLENTQRESLATSHPTSVTKGLGLVVVGTVMEATGAGLLEAAPVVGWIGIGVGAIAQCVGAVRNDRASSPPSIH